MLRRLHGWLRSTLRRDVVEREMQEELQLHLERAAERLIARGLSPAAARAAALREFGNVASIEEAARDARGVRWVSDAVQDIRHALRRMRLEPGFSFAVIGTLGLGIGANATMFGIVDRLLFRPPASVIAPERAHRLYLARIFNGVERMGTATSYQRYLDLVESSTMEVVAAYSPRLAPIDARETARERPIGAASASLWQLFDARPAVGRFFTAEEDREPDGSRVAVLSYAYWQSQYAGSPAVLGTTIRIGPVPYTVIGVAPRGFAGVELETPNAFIPIGMAAVDELGSEWTRERTAYSMNWLELYGRRKPGVTHEAATKELSALFRSSYRNQMTMDPRLAPIDVANPRIVLGSMLAERGPYPSTDARIATWLLGVTVIVLLIACANVGNLLLGRALRRRREVALRLALGVGRARLIRQSLIESTVLAFFGAVAGLILAQWGGQVLRAALMPAVEWGTAIADRRILLVATIAAVASGLLAGIAPLVQASRADVITALRTGARDGRDGPSRLRGALMLAQVALSAMLLIGAGLLMRSVQHIGGVKLGYDADRLLLTDAHLLGVELDSARKAGLRHSLVERAMSSALVENATLVCSVPFFGTCGSDVFVDGGDSINRLGEFVRQTASPTYFATTGARIVRGRGISPDDRAGGPLVAVVSEAMARALWPARDAIGQCMRAKSVTAPCRTVVGVVVNEKHQSIGDGDPGFVYYIPAAQATEREWGDPQQIRLFVRVRGDPASQVAAVARELQSVMPGSGYLVVRPMTDVVGRVTRSWRLGATMFAVFGVLALTLAAIGVYSVVAYDVAQRTHEVGVRIALGASVGNVVALVARDILQVVVAGAGVGIALALAAGPWLGPLLFEVSPRDPIVFGVVAALLTIVAAAASAMPASRAAKVDPIRALRSD
jgi:putative ABC transport system permease protein